MRNLMYYLLTLSIFLVMQSNAISCEFNTDCEPGSKCIKVSGSLYEVCVGGIASGNSNDKVPVSAPMDLNQTYGNTCQFNTDCGPGSTCVRSSGSIYGTCMKK